MYNKVLLFSLRSPIKMTINIKSSWQCLNMECFLANSLFLYTHIYFIA